MAYWIRGKIEQAVGNAILIEARIDTGAQRRGQLQQTTVKEGGTFHLEFSHSFLWDEKQRSYETHLPKGVSGRESSRLLDPHHVDPDVGQRASDFHEQREHQIRLTPSVGDGHLVESLFSYFLLKRKAKALSPLP